jgi:lipopolysaccharide/colanic/teichoic acid biosynthesis glycosyltransferase
LLRRSKLDEVPQLLNVLKGEMGVVGPRPEDPGYVARYPEQFAELLEVRPGLTGAATILFREEEMLLGGGAVEDTYLTRVLPSKLEIELEYLRHRSFFTDAQLVFQTAVWLISHRAPNGVSRAWPRGSERRANG